MHVFLKIHGGPENDIKEKIAKVMVRCGKMRPMFDSPDLRVAVKIRLYQVPSGGMFDTNLRQYGSKMRRLTPQVMLMRQLNGANSIMLARFPGQHIPQEAHALTHLPQASTWC